MTSLVISGCSWSCGEVLPPMLHVETSYKWTTLNSRTMITHPGLSAYLEDKFEIVNISQCEASNWQNLWTIKNFHDTNKKWRSACWLLFQTDFLRDEGSRHWQVDYGSMQKKLGLFEFYQTVADSFYRCANELADSLGIKIFLCGGLTDLDLNLLQNYDQVIPVHPSWISLMCADHVPDLKCVEMPHARLLETTKQKASTDFMNQLFDHIDLSKTKFDLLLQTGYFGPYHGNFHPNRQGHKLMANVIRNFFNEDAV